MPSSSDVASLRQNLLVWFEQCGRHYPWRDTRDPFRVLVAEIMLRRTRAAQVVGVYGKVLAAYPDARSLAAARGEDIDKLTYSLGLKWRIPAFRLVAEAIVANHHGIVPSTRAELLRLPGVGDYVAGAVLSVAYGQKEWIVDSNVVRVFARFFGIPTSREGRRDKMMIRLAREYASCEDPRSANLAVVDFGALVCSAKKPDCSGCMFAARCASDSHV